MSHGDKPSMVRIDYLTHLRDLCARRSCKGLVDDQRRNERRSLDMFNGPAVVSIGSQARISFTLRLRLLDPQHQTSSGHGAMVCEGP